MAVDEYTSVQDVKDQLGITDDDDDDLIQSAVTAASRWIDSVCETTFYPVTEARVFEATPGANGVLVDKFVDATGLVVKTGTYGSFTTTVPSGDLVLYPLNAPSKAGGAYYKIVTLNRGWPASSTGYSYVQVTASWGWSTVPAEIAEAALITAAQLYRRKDSPEAVIGTLDETISRLYAMDDPNVARLLRDFREIGAY